MSADGSGPAIEVADLRKRYGVVQAVDGVSFRVARGEVYGMLGPNGAGKTTTVEIVEGLRRADSGHAVVLGHDVAREARQVKARIGVQLQTPTLLPRLTVRELLELFGSFFPRARPAADLIRLVNLEESAGRYAGALSGGQAQRLSIALALVNDPEVVFLDEPTTGLDPQARVNLWELVERIRAGGATVVLTTHYMEEAERLCDRVAIVDHGRVIALGAPAELIARVGGEHVVEFAVAGDGPVDAPAFADLPSVRATRAEGDGFALTVGEPHTAIPALLDRLADQGRTLARLTTRQASLEDVFVALTGRHLRDEEPEPPPEGVGRRGRRRARSW